MKLVLDTNVFANKDFCNWLKERDEIEKILPSIAYMEFVYHHLKQGKNEDIPNKFLEVHRIAVAPFDAKIALAAARSAIGKWDFKENARDYTIGATAEVHDAKLITYNARDFEWLPKGTVFSPEKIIRKLQCELSDTVEAGHNPS